MNNSRQIIHENLEVKQAGFLVLRETTMPSVLFEAGYLTNPDDEKLLLSKEGQIKTASALFRAIKTYRMQFDSYQPVQKNKDSVSVSKEKLASDRVEQVDDQPQMNTEKVDTKPQVVLEKPVFAVQFAMFEKKSAPAANSFNGLGDVYSYETNGYTKFVVGQYKSLKEAVRRQNEMRGTRYKDAFVVAFINGNRISIKEALQ